MLLMSALVIELFVFLIEDKEGRYTFAITRASEYKI